MQIFNEISSIFFFSFYFILSYFVGMQTFHFSPYSIHIQFHIDSNVYPEYASFHSKHRIWAKLYYKWYYRTESFLGVRIAYMMVPGYNRLVVVFAPTLYVSLANSHHDVYIIIFFFSGEYKKPKEKKKKIIKKANIMQKYK